MEHKDTPRHRMLFGMKLRHYRTTKNFSFQDLSDLTGISKSYLNEMEMGIKYPKPPKRTLLAKALDVPVSELESDELPDILAPLGALLQSNFLQELPLEMLSLDLPRMLAMLAQAPTKVSAFIATLLELSRSYSNRESHFFFGALRSYLELNHNYFPDLEAAASECLQVLQIGDTPAQHPQKLAAYLNEKWGCATDFNGLDGYPDLQTLRGVWVAQSNTLLLSGRLDEGQQSFQLAKEIGFRHLQLEQRANTSSLLQFHTFEEVLNHFKAGYFAAALLLPQTTFLAAMRQWMQLKSWHPQQVIDWLEDYRTTPETLFQRMTNLLPAYLGVKELFFVRATLNQGETAAELSKELHLENTRRWQMAGTREHFCARRISVSMLKPSNGIATAKYAVEAQIIELHNDATPYFCVAISWQSKGQPMTATLGIRLTEHALAQMPMVKDPQLRMVQVHNTCERCPISDCKERLSPPVLYEQKKAREALKLSLQSLNNTDER